MLIIRNTSNTEGLQVQKLDIWGMVSSKATGIFSFHHHIKNVLVPSFILSNGYQGQGQLKH